MTDFPHPTICAGHFTTRVTAFREHVSDVREKGDSTVTFRVKTHGVFPEDANENYRGLKDLAMGMGATSVRCRRDGFNRPETVTVRF